MLVVITGPAEQELEEIADYIARDRPARAASFVLELLARCDSLADNPRRYPLVAGHEATQIRQCQYSRYLIYYRVEKKSLEVLHILHSAMDQEQILFPDA